MKYKINRERILEILAEFDSRFDVTDKAIYLFKYDFKLRLTEMFVEDVKNRNIDTDNKRFIENVIIEKLHSYFDECFEEYKGKVTMKKAIEFLEDSKFEVIQDMEMYYICITKVLGRDKGKTEEYARLNDIVDELNGIQTSRGLEDLENVIYTYLNNNREELMEG